MMPNRPFDTMADRTMPIPAVRPSPAAHGVPRRSRGAAVARLAVVVVAGVLALAVTAATAFVLGSRGAAPVTPAAVAAAPVAPPPVAAPAPIAEPGPALVDTAGSPVTPEFAAVITRVYRALDAGDLETVRKAYSAAGSDDWFTSAPHLESSSVRAKVLTALREAPSARDGYRYRAGSYTVRFGQDEGYPEPGLWTIEGPWGDETAAGTDTSSDAAPSSGSPSPDPSPTTSSCSGGSIPVPTEGLPCQDPQTGRGVEFDGTVGVHGLKPCPYGTTIPSDPDEPTRNATTGEVCGIV